MPPKIILVIDDDPEFLRSLCGVLRSAGYEVLEAANGAEAVAKLESQTTKIDLMIVDLCLPDMNGMEIVGAVTRRQLPVKIIAASGVFDQAYLDMVKGAGADDSIRKEPGGLLTEKWLETVSRLLGEGESSVPEQKLVLVVDDESAVRRFVRAILQRRGFQVLEAADGDQGLAMVERLDGKLDLLIVDIQMPHVDGISFAKSVRSSYPNIPLIFISGFKPPELGGLCQDPRTYFLQKPFLPKAMLAAIDSVMPATKNAGDQ